MTDPTEMFTGTLGLIFVFLVIALAAAAIFMPFFVWGIYNQSVKQTQLLRDLLAKPTITPRAQPPPIQPERNPPTTRLRR